MTNVNPNQPAQGQQAAAGGDVHQMTVGQLLQLANQQNIDTSALNNLLQQVNVSPNVSPQTNIAGTGGAGNQPASQT
jgi:hypothetical protein